MNYECSLVVNHIRFQFSISLVFFVVLVFFFFTPPCLMKWNLCLQYKSWWWYASVRLFSALFWPAGGGVGAFNFGLVSLYSFLCVSLLFIGQSFIFLFIVGVLLLLYTLPIIYYYSNYCIYVRSSTVIIGLAGAKTQKDQFRSLDSNLPNQNLLEF